ncbi:MAG: Two-component transcriptional response regulator, NarL/FixJ family [Ktedonobacterales bacterium]|nr:MAG: Two-component transcriptional response regulator, NarL/FixJ family [Ktedonobacterales bacterium]
MTTPSTGSTPADATAIRILICEDQTLMREGLRTVLDLEPGFVIVGEAADGAEGVRLAEQLRPDIILMDIQMPRQNGVQATAAITARGLPSRVIILTTFDYEDYVFDAIKAGAVSYLLKDTPAAELAATIRRVYAGESFIQPSVATKLLMEFGRRGPVASESDPRTGDRDTAGASNQPDTEGLSQREVDVLRLLAQGASNRDIADQLVLAEGTVKNHVSNILMKLHAANRTQAANLARERGLI